MAKSELWHYCIKATILLAIMKEIFYLAIIWICALTVSGIGGEVAGGSPEGQQTVVQVHRHFVFLEVQELEETLANHSWPEPEEKCRIYVEKWRYCHKKKPFEWSMWWWLCRNPSSWEGPSPSTSGSFWTSLCTGDSSAAAEGLKNVIVI